MSTHEPDEPSETLLNDLDAPPKGVEPLSLLGEPDHAVLLLRLQRSACFILPLSFVVVFLAFGSAAPAVMSCVVIAVTAFYLGPHFSYRTRAAMLVLAPLLACLYLAST